MKQEVFRPMDHLSVLSLHYPAYDIVRDIRVYIPGKLYKAGGEIELAGLPGEIKRVNGYAVTAEARARIKRLKSEGLCLRGLYDLPDIHVHPVAEHLKLIDEGDIDPPVDVLKKFCHLRNPC